MSMAKARRAAGPVCMGLLLATIGFTYSLATNDGARTPVIPPGCSLPAATFISGAFSDAASGVFPPAPPNPPGENCFDLGSVVVNRDFTRILNVQDGFPPFEFRVLPRGDGEPNNADLDVEEAADGSYAKLIGATQESARLRASTPDQPPPAGLDGSLLPQLKLIDIEIADQNPNPLLAIQVFTFCATVVPVLEGNSNFGIVDGINASGGLGVITPTGPAPVIDGFTVLAASDATSFNDLPTGLQNQAYEYQLHANGGDRFGGDVENGTFTPVDDTDTSNYSGAITVDPTSIYGGGASGTYTFEADNVGGGSDLDLIVSFDGDDDELGLAGSTTQTFFDVFGPGGVIGPTQLLSVGSLGLRVNINQSKLVLVGVVNVLVRAHAGDNWTVTVTALEAINQKFSLHPNSPFNTDILALSTEGLLSGTPGRSGDFTFIINVDQYDPSDTDQALVLNRSTRQLFVRILPAPVSSQFVAHSGGFRLKFGAARRDSLKLTLFLAKGALRDFSELRGASFDMTIGNDPATQFVLSSQVSGALTFTKSGLLKYPHSAKPGGTVGAVISDARVNIAPLNPDNGMMRLTINRVDLSEAIGAATAGVGATIEVPITIQITGGEGLDLTFDEIVTFGYRTAGSNGIGRVLRGPAGATAGIGQFIIPKANAKIIFDAASGGSDTLDMTMSGFMRLPSRAPIAVPADSTVNILLGAQCVYEGTFDDFVARGTKLILINKNPSVPLEKMIIDNRKGTFTLKLKSPATNVSTIQGATGGLVIDSSKPFNMNVRFRLSSPAGASFFDAQYPLILFRTGNKLNMR